MDNCLHYRVVVRSPKYTMTAYQHVDRNRLGNICG